MRESAISAILEHHLRDGLKTWRHGARCSPKLRMAHNLTTSSTGMPR